MQKTQLFLALIALCGLFFTCKSTRYNADNLPTQQLRWGNGGGFTGVETTFLLLENGQIFKGDNLKSGLVEQAKAKKKTAKKVFAQIAKIPLATLVKTPPGNTYAFVEVPDGKGGMERVSFDLSKAGVDQDVLALYQALEALRK